MSLADLFSGDEERARAALEKVSEADVPELVEAAATRATENRAWAVAALGTISAPAAVNALIALTADADPEVRAAVFFALGQQRAPEAITPLMFALSERSPYLARLAADALIQIGPPAVPALCEALNREVETAVRVNLARALALMADTRSIPALFRALEDDSAMVQYWADHGLEKMGVGQVYFKP